MEPAAHVAWEGGVDATRPSRQPPPLQRQMSRTSSQKLRRAAWKMVRTQSSKGGQRFDQVVRAWKIRNEVPRWMQQTQEDAMAMFAAAKPHEKAESLRNFAVQQQPRQPVWQFFVKLSGQTEDETPEDEMFESKWEEVEDLLRPTADPTPGAHQAPTDFGPLGELPMHVCFLLCYSGKTQKLKNVMKRIAKEVVQQYYRPGPWPTINEPYENDFQLWFRLGKELPKYKLTEKSGGDEHGMYTGETILHIAIANQDREMVRWMLDNGASLHAEATGSFFLPKVIKVIEDGYSYRTKSALPDLERRLSTDSVEGDTPEQVEEGGLGMRERAGKAAGWVRRAVVAWLRGMEVNDARVTLKKNHYSAYASIASDTEQKEAADDGHAAAVESEHEEAGLVSITKSMLYFGGMPLSFAVTVGDLAICRLLIAKAQEGERNSVLNKTDHYGGNTALHMAALHGRREIFDWLVEEGRKHGKNSLSIMNRDGHTALTLAARMGNVDLFKHILRNHFRFVVWTFGDLQLSQTSLEQVDTFKIQKQAASGEAEQAPEERVEREGSLIVQWWKQHTRRFSRGNSFKLKRKFHRLPAVEKEVWELHRERKFRSALQVIVDHEIEAFCEDELFNALVMEKWEKFGFRLYALRTLVPYFCFLVVFTVHVINRCREIRLRWATHFTGDPEAQEHAPGVRESTFLSGMVAFFGVLFFVDGWSHRRLRPEDLNPEQDGDMTTSKVMRAVYRNMSFGLSLAISAVVILAFAFQVIEEDYLELNMMAISCIFVFCYLLHTLVPFKMFGVLVIMIYRIFVKDVLYFLIIYMFLLCAFGIGIWMMFQKARYPDELDYGQIRMDEYVGASLLSSVWVSLHEVDTADYISASQFPGLSMSFHLVWILFSTVLLLNLLIGLMRQTFDKDKTSSASHRLWIFPFASLVLRHEKMLSTWWARRLLRFKHPARYRSGLMKNNHIDFVDDDDEIASQRFYQVNLDKVSASEQASDAQAAAAAAPDAAPAEEEATPANEEDAHKDGAAEARPPAAAPPPHAAAAQQGPERRAGGAAGRKALPPPPTALDQIEMPHGKLHPHHLHHHQGHHPQDGARKAEALEQGLAPPGVPGLQLPGQKHRSGEAEGRGRGVGEATRRVEAMQERMERVQQRLAGVEGVRERQPELVRDIAGRVQQCGRAIAAELRPLVLAVAECEGRLQAVEAEGEAVAEAVAELDHRPARTDAAQAQCLGLAA